MQLLNSKSILDCETEEEENNHKKEIEKVMEAIYSTPNYRTILRYHFVDVAHQRNLDMFRSYHLHELLESIDGIDLKNGYDFAIQNNDTLTVIVYGQYYMMNNSFHIVETHIDVLPFDNCNKFVNIISRLLP